ncbi:MAG: M48 family metallopeptidase, partial [Syntrophales bacterium]|nr:M48 family metallopeptidase [Syntrophales bacterium]
MDISYEIIRSPRRHRTITLQITEGRLVVRAPWFATEEAIQRFCQRRRTWIEEMLRSITPLPVAERDPHPIWYLGIAYPTVLTDKTTVCLHNGRFLIPREGSRTAIEAWFITRARAYVPLRVQYYTTLAGYTPRAIRIGRARSRWGSCSGDNRLT